MFEKLSIKLIAIGLAIMLVLGGLYWIYHSIRESGYREAQVECQEKFHTYQREVNEKLSNLQHGLQNISGDLGTSTAILSSDMQNIAFGMRKQQNLIIKDGKCNPSQSFVDSINRAIDRANKK